ncbi:prepilin-type N-terminal cleavage/methylation domain-containing protein (plasmid) [Ralstonia syzygii]|uniref:Type II secretion system protein H n=1 Tax=Ralstonia syzygii TaxID=28097 RepID=A0ABX7ZN53_9RALS|nr:Tfp pilus assembly protein FimT/FimU [Ralstonia syzygii]QUP56666.1 prepilin-type N-terminal cleavage/methylation domain-containing protein [Ralstonia syzygii]
MASKLACQRARSAQGFALIEAMVADRSYVQDIVCSYRMAAASGRARGFTLVELVIVISIVAILVTLAAPSFQSTIQSARTTTEVNSLVNDLQFARSEAIKRGQPVSICVSSDGATCLASNKWQVGWIVFNDVNGSGALDSTTDVVLRKRAAFAGSDTFVASPTTTVLTYNREGFATGLTNGTVTMVLHTAPVNQQATRCVAINVVGRQVVQNAGTGSCS